MRVSASEPFQIIYSMYWHDHLGYVFESFIIHLDERGRLTFQHQNISSKNAEEFGEGLDQTDFQLIKWMDQMNPDAVLRKFSKKVMKANDFFNKVFHPEKGDKPLGAFISNYMEDLRGNILEKLAGKFLFEMGNDGEPTARKVETSDAKAAVVLHIHRESENTLYHPSITYQGKPLRLPDPDAYMVCHTPAWLVIQGHLVGFEQSVQGKKLKPFLTKEKVVIPRKLEETYYTNVVPSLVEAFKGIDAKGFAIHTLSSIPQPVLTMSELLRGKTRQLSITGQEEASTVADDEAGKITFSLSFRYGKYKLERPNKLLDVVWEKEDDTYAFYRIERNREAEENYAGALEKLGLELQNLRVSMYKGAAFSWLNINRVSLLNYGFEVSQPDHKDKKYFVGKAVMELEVRESIDWFDVHAVIRFGEFEIPFKELRKLVVRKKVEFALPNGEIAIIPESWLSKYHDLFVMSEVSGKGEKPIIRKHHFHVLKELQENKLAKVKMSARLQNLESFHGVKNYPLPEGFKGKLRPYQKAGYNWMNFLAEFRLGGCLADDMGLGKTVQTLALLLSQKQNGGNTSLLVMPTSLIYNWEKEAARFTPDLKVLTYTGSQRNKDVSRFASYDLVLTSYGILRLDIDNIETFAFNYCILDESQVIKNPSSNTARAVRRLQSKFKLTLTGTPLENTTMDLWSQITFINPGLLGTVTFFKKEYLVPIEKKADKAKLEKLQSVIKPFVLRRLKSQVATDLPEKSESIQYTDMTPEQEARYEEAKAYYRDKVLRQIEKDGINNSRLTILEGLTRLRQLSNHPRMVDPAYHGDSGKLQDVTHMIENALLEGHKLLIFSQFVKHLGIFREHLRSKGIPYAYLDGASADRAQQVERFNRDPNLRIFLISIKAGGLGLNLTQADYVFILDPWWNPATEAQAIDRAHRIGQTRKVFTYKFIARNTVEEKILKLQGHKRKLSESLVQVEESVVKSLTREDVENLME